MCRCLIAVRVIVPLIYINLHVDKYHSRHNHKWSPESLSIHGRWNEFILYCFLARKSQSKTIFFFCFSFCWKLWFWSCFLFRLYLPIFFFGMLHFYTCQTVKIVWYPLQNVIFFKKKFLNFFTVKFFTFFSCIFLNIGEKIGTKCLIWEGLH